MSTPTKTKQTTKSAGKRQGPSHVLFLFYIWLVEREARFFFEYLKQSKVMIDLKKETAR